MDSSIATPNQQRARASISPNELGFVMYNKILIPTDGSPISNAAAHAGVAFAKQNQAEVTAIFVSPTYQYPIYVEMIPPNFPTEDEFKASMREAGEKYLAGIRREAEAAGVKFSGFTTFSDLPAKEIVHAAESAGCDLIFMGSHGRSGWGQALLGSVTSKVLSICQIPVLVYRIKKEAAPA